MHKRSRSDPFQGKAETEKLNDFVAVSDDHFNMREIGHLKGLVKANKIQSRRTEDQISLNQEILKLRKRLRSQVVVRQALEKALRYKPHCKDVTNEESIPETAKELIKEIAVLELEVMYLESYLLSLYRKAFNRRISSLLTLDKPLKPNSPAHNGIYGDVPSSNVMLEKETSYFQPKVVMSPRSSVGSPTDGCNSSWEQQKLLEDSRIFRSHSSLSHRSGCSFRMSPQSKVVAKAMDSYHSLPLSMLEQAHIDALVGGDSGYISDNIIETPNRLSEEMINCIAKIICQLADAPLIGDNQDCLFSPASLSSYTNVCSRDFSSTNCDFNSPFHTEEEKAFACPYDAMAMIQSVSKDCQKLRETEHKLNYYRSLVNRLEGVNPGKMTHEEKLAFWINVHNALVMHALLVYGTPESNVKRISLTLKAAYNVGGRTINVDTIQSSILGCRIPRPGQWLRFLFTPKTKLKAGDTRKEYAIDRPEPLLYFVLCSGNHSDPAVRVYTTKRVFQELEAAKGEYMRSSFSISKEGKILLPKIVESYAKESDLCPAGITAMMEHSLPCSSRKKIIQCQNRKSGKKIAIDWIPHSFAFRFVISRELV